MREAKEVNQRRSSFHVFRSTARHRRWLAHLFSFRFAPDIMFELGQARLGLDVMLAGFGLYGMAAYHTREARKGFDLAFGISTPFFESHVFITYWPHSPALQEED